MSAARERLGDDRVASVIVVTHNNRGLIGDCLRAIYGSASTHDLDVIVLDNNSSDGTTDVVVRGGWPVNVVALAENVGFARGVNRAREVARGRHLVLVNSDAFLDTGCIDALLARLEGDPAAGIVGARLRYPSGALHPAGGTFPSLLGGLWVALFLHRVPGLSRAGIGYLADAHLYRRPRRVDWVCAAACAARVEVGPMPESSFMYGEDVAWARACRDAGYEVWLEPAASAVHIGRASVDASQDVSFAQRQRAEFELEWFAQRGPVAVLLARGVLLVHAAMRIALFGALALVRRRRDRRVTEFAALARAALAPRAKGS